MIVFDWPFGTSALYAEWHRIQRATGIHVPCPAQREYTDTCHVYGFHALKKVCGTLDAFMRHRSSRTAERCHLNRTGLLEGQMDNNFVPEVLGVK